MSQRTDTLDLQHRATTWLAQFSDGQGNNQPEAEALVRELLAALQAPVGFTVIPIHHGEEDDGPYESTDLFLTSRGLALLVNIPKGSEATYSLAVDQTRQSGHITPLGPASPLRHGHTP